MVSSKTLGLLIGSSLLVHAGLCSPLMAQDQGSQLGEPDAHVQDVQPAVDQNAQDMESDLRERVSRDAVAALTEATDALRALDDGRYDDAVASLERSIGKLELVLRRAPDLAIAPVGVSTRIYDLYADRDSVKESIRDAERLIDRGRIQDARELLGLMRSEIVTSTSYLPMATFPDAIAGVVPLIDDGRYEEAKSLLASTLNTVVVVDRITPLPVLRAQLLLDEAEKLAEKSDRSDEESDRLAELLESAEDQLSMADLLGYGDKGDFEPMYDELKSIRKKTRNGRSGTGFFETIRSEIRGVLDKVGGSDEPSGDQVSESQPQSEHGQS